ncbi:MAG: DUF5320 domain-containing protein [Candidatus Komeilibacteria bacterium]
MPNLDQTGPAGNGPVTGGGRGSCADGQSVGRNGFFRSCCGRFFGRGRFANNVNVSLDDQEKILTEELKAVQEAKKLEKK